MEMEFTKRGDAVPGIQTRLSATSVWMLIGAATVAVSTIILGLTMERWPDPYFQRPATIAIFYPIGPGPKAMPAINADLLDVYASDESHVWVVGNNALIAYSKDGGATWEKATVINPPAPATASAPTTTTTPTTKAQPPPRPNLGSKSRANKKAVSLRLVSEAFADTLRPLCVEHENLASIQRPANGNGSFQVHGAALGHYESRDGRTWTCVGRAAFARHPEAHVGDKYWETQGYGVLKYRRGISDGFVVTPTQRNLNHLFFASPSVGWAVGDHGVILKTTDGGENWRHQTRESMYNESLLPGSPILPILPPWYLIANGFSAYAFFRSRTEAQKQQRTFSQQWIDSKGERDSPLEPDDADARNLEPLAKAIADFIRNPETKPPMTIAVTGAWGSGKSSLMNLIRHRLMKSAWRPVWFNAWHHQKEESLLAALLQTIRMQAVPKLWERGGPSFYTRLFLIRLRNYQARVVALAMLVCFSVGFVMTYPLILDRLKDHSSAGHGLVDRIADFLPPATANVVLTIGTILTVLYGLFKGLSAFGVKPAELLADVAGGARIKDLDAQMSFRERFAREFREVTSALNPWRSLLIFIDDLDRCRPDNVVEVLESVNFLVSSGDCFVILGMARDKVQPAVGLAFKEMAAEMVLPPDMSEHDRRQELARDYLDKLINFEVAVPRQSFDDSLRSLTREEAIPVKPWWHIDPLRAASIAALSAITVLLPLSMLFSGITAATMAYVSQSEHDQQYIHAVSTKAKGGGANAPAAAPAAAPVSVQASAVSNQPGTIAAAAEVRDRWMYWPVFVPLIVLLWIAIWLIRRADDDVVRDSVEFTEALKIWHPVLYEYLPTPRAMKRFKNKVRFLATRVRAHASPTIQLSEHAIVALAAIRVRFSNVQTAKDFAAKNPDSTFGTAYAAHVKRFFEGQLVDFDRDFDADVRDVEFR